MLKNRFFALTAAVALVGLAACNGGEEDVVTDETTVQTPIVETDTALAPVVAPVETTDTGLVETTVETDVDVEREVVEEPNP